MFSIFIFESLSIRYTATKNPTEGSLGVEGTFVIFVSPVCSFTIMPSVNVPPTSIPILYLELKIIL